MPRVLVRNNRVVTRNGRVLIDSPGCRTACCGGTQPPCCPSICGQQFNICVLEMRSYGRIVHRVRNLVAGNPPTLQPSVFTGTREIVLNASPIPNEPHTTTDCQAEAILPVRDTQEVERNGPAEVLAGFNFDPCLATDYYCRVEAMQCPSPVVVASSSLAPPVVWQPPDGSRWVGEPNNCALPPFGSGAADRLDWMGTNSGTYTYPGDTPQTVTDTIIHSWSFVPESGGSGAYIYDLTSSRTVEVVGSVGSVAPIDDGASMVFEYHLRIRVVPVLNCDGTAGPPLACVAPPHDCEGTQRYIIGRQCVGEPTVRPIPIIPIENVRACRVLAMQGTCWEFRPDGRVTTRPGDFDNNIDYRIVDENTGSATCCQCLPNCPSTSLVPQRCWLNASRGAGGQLVVSPSFVEGDCCCRDDDIITIVRAYGRVDRPGVQQIWNLRDGAISFRRDDPDPIPGGVFSRITDLEGNPLVPNDIYAHGPFNNDPPMGCQWDQLGAGPFGLYFPFATPQLGLAAAPIGLNVLPCPADPDVPSFDGWVIRTFAVVVTCDTFTYQAVYDNPVYGGTFEARTQVTVTPSGLANNQRCGGGCTQKTRPQPTGNATAIATPSLLDVLGGG